MGTHERSISCREMWQILLLLCLIASTQDASQLFVGAFSNTLRIGPPAAFSSRISHFGLPHTTRLQASTSIKYGASSSTTKVLYQKVIRPPPTLPDILFLGYLVEYLESYFELPGNLPMIYESIKPKQDAQYILEVDSPLSPASDVTRMEVEVVGIYTSSRDAESKKDTNSETPSVPNMAMVVVKKAKNPQSSIPSMMENLFEDSEKKILKALDRGLEEFLQGKIQFKDDEDVKEKPLPNLRTAEQVIEAELMDEAPSIGSASKQAPEDVVVEAYATSDDSDRASKTKSTEVENSVKNEAMSKGGSYRQTEGTAPKTKSTAPKKVKETTIKKGETSASTAPKSNPPGLDFAVRAAKQAAAKRRKAKAAATAKDSKSASSPPEDFAIAAARKAAAMKKKSKSKVTKQKTKAKAVTRVKGAGAAVVEQQARPISIAEVDQNQSPPGLDREYMAKTRSFGLTISRPGERGKKPKNKTTAKNWVAQEKKESTQKVVSIPSGSESTPKSKSSSRKPLSSPDAVKTQLKAEELPVEDKVETEEAKKPSKLGKAEDATNKAPGTKPMPSGEQIELDVINAAKDVIDEMVDGSEDMTAEELLRDILKFDEEETKKNEPGSGFVSGAFEKAKQIMKDRYKQRQEMSTKTIDGSKPNIGDLNQFPVDADAPMSEEEELKRMFQAGEQIADTRITKSMKDNVDLAFEQGSAADEVDQLIANEKSVSSYAKVLDDELVELELSINPTPGEELDEPMRNPMFDVMSGPEVYNPNTEMDAVNYPGALPGTKEVRLPKELDEAKKQAEFASSVLKKLRTEVTKDENGDAVKTQYFVGDKEMTMQQVNDLQSVVSEAAEIGIITDPVNLMQESSRLQLLVDELWNQPKERFHDIAENYKDLILSHNFVPLVKERMQNMVERDLDALRRDDESLKETHEREREILGQLVVYAQLLLKEVRALGAELEAQQLEVVRSICKVAMDPRHTTEEETAMALTDAVRDMRPLLDDMVVAYLKYAVAEEKGRLARAGLLDDPAHNQWLFVLQIVQQGVYEEISKGINRYIDHIGYVLRMKTPRQRRMLLEKLIDVMPSMDVRPFVQVVENIVASLGDGARGEFEGIDVLGGLTNELLQLHKDVKELLPPERIAVMARDADEWAERQRKRLAESRNVTKQRLQAANDNAHLQEEIEAVGRRGEMERIE